MAILSDERRRLLREWGRKGGQARAQQFTSSYQRAARACVRRESLRRAGRRGYARTLETRGADFVGRIAAAWRRKNPSPLESIVMTWLDRLCVEYIREHPLASSSGDDTYYLDFYITSHGAVVEVDGDGWHRLPDRMERDRQRNALCRAAGLPLLRIPERDVRSGAAWETLSMWLFDIQTCHFTRSDLEA